MEVEVMGNRFTIENSILLNEFDETLESNILSWLEVAAEDFGRIQGFLYEYGFVKSIDGLEFVKTEIRELNSFFASGKCDSLAIHTDKNIFTEDFTEKILYKYYKKLLSGDYDSFINEENKDWHLAARIQALLWSKEYLERLPKNLNEFKIERTKHILPVVFDVDTGVEVPLNELAKKGDSIKHGYRVSSPEITPALYNALVENKLIEDEGLEKLKLAFEDGEGLITWFSAGSCLAYLLDEMNDNKIIINTDFWKESEYVFKIEGKHSSLKNSKDKVGKINKAIVDKIIKALTLL